MTRSSLSRSIRSALLALSLSLAPAACAVPKFSAGPEPGIAPQPDTPSPDTIVVSSHKKKHAVGDILLVYAVALVILAALYFKVSDTDAH